jgi:HTH-type transcriptional regulator/antitoxin HigA
MIKLIKSDQDLEKTLERIADIWDANKNSNDFEEREILSLLVQKYEDEHYTIPESKPIEALKFIMEHKNLTRKDLEPFIGSSGRVSEILNGKRELTLNMIKKLHNQLHIPYDSLITG